MEQWDVYDSNAQKTGRVVAAFEELVEGEYRLAGEIWPVNAAGEILIQRRSDACAVLPGVWSLTTGKVQRGETAREGAVREFHEELGAKIAPEQLIWLKQIVRRDGTKLIWNVFCLPCELDANALRLQKDEVAAVKWVRRSEFKALLDSGKLYAYPEIDEILNLVLKSRASGGQ